MSRLDGKVAFVTGAGGGIGRAMCERFLAEGASVAATDIDAGLAAEAVASAPRGRAISLGCDVTSSAAVREAIGRAVEAFGKLNVLCNVAGGSTLQDGIVTEAPEEEFWRTIKLDLFGTFVCCKHGLPELIRAGGGAVVNMASMVALIAYGRHDCYTAAKGGVVALTRSMAAEYAPYAIRVNAIAPGITLSPRVKARKSAAGSPLAVNHLLGFVEPVEIAHLAVYLASDEARRTTGQILSVDSGVTAV